MADEVIEYKVTADKQSVDDLNQAEKRANITRERIFQAVSIANQLMAKINQAMGNTKLGQDITGGISLGLTAAGFAATAPGLAAAGPVGWGVLTVEGIVLLVQAVQQAMESTSGSARERGRRYDLEGDWR